MLSHQNTESCVLQYQAEKWGPDNRHNRKILTPKEINSKRQAITTAEPRLHLQNKDTSIIDRASQARKPKRLRAHRDDRKRLTKASFSLPAQPGHLPGFSNLSQVCITRYKLSLDTERTVLSETVWTKKVGSKQINMFKVFDLFFVHALCVLSVVTSIDNSLFCPSRRGKKRMSFRSTEDEL